MCKLDGIRFFRYVQKKLWFKPYKVSRSAERLLWKLLFLQLRHCLKLAVYPALLFLLQWAPRFEGSIQGFRYMWCRFRLHQHFQLRNIGCIVRERVDTVWNVVFPLLFSSLVKPWSCESLPFFDTLYLCAKNNLDLVTKKRKEFLIRNAFKLCMMKRLISLNSVQDSNSDLRTLISLSAALHPVPYKSFRNCFSPERIRAWNYGEEKISIESQKRDPEWKEKRTGNRRLARWCVLSHKKILFAVLLN